MEAEHGDIKKAIVVGQECIDSFLEIDHPNAETMRNEVESWRRRAE